MAPDVFHDLRLDLPALQQPHHHQQRRSDAERTENGAGAGAPERRTLRKTMDDGPMAGASGADGEQISPKVGCVG
jgi:hypothetical protein